MILIINNHSHFLPKLKKIVKKHHACIVRDQRSMLDNVPDKKIKGIILSGGGPNLDCKVDLDAIRADIAALLNYKVPVLGICEGHQIIAEIFGGEIEKLNKQRYGENKIKIKNKKAIFKSLPKEIMGMEAHKRYVKKIPKSFSLVASSNLNKVEALFHRTKSIYTVQFHPEASGKHGEKIIENFLEICEKH